MNNNNNIFKKVIIVVLKLYSLCDKSFMKI